MPPNPVEGLRVALIVRPHHAGRVVVPDLALVRESTRVRVGGPEHGPHNALPGGQSIAETVVRSLAVRLLHVGPREIAFRSETVLEVTFRLVNRGLEDKG